MDKIIGQKQCRRCYERKLLSEFYTNPRRKDGIHSWCKECVNIGRTIRMKENPRLELKYRLASKFRITLEQYDDILKKQNGICPCCQMELSEKLHLDHFKERNKIRIRGIIHENCNIGIGHFKHNSQWLRAAADYLEREPVI